MDRNCFLIDSGFLVLKIDLGFLVSGFMVLEIDLGFPVSGFLFYGFGFVSVFFAPPPE